MDRSSRGLKHQLLTLAELLVSVGLADLAPDPHPGPPLRQNSCWRRSTWTSSCGATRAGLRHWPRTSTLSSWRATRTLRKLWSTTRRLGTSPKWPSPGPSSGTTSFSPERPSKQRGPASWTRSKRELVRSSHLQILEDLAVHWALRQAGRAGEAAGMAAKTRGESSPGQKSASPLQYQCQPFTVPAPTLYSTSANLYKIKKLQKKTFLFSFVF